MLVLRRILPLPLVLLLLPAVASAQSPAPVSEADRATARQLAADGKAALERKDYAAAADRFARADSIVHAPTLLMGLARAQTGLGKWVAATGLYRRILREGVAPGSPPAFFDALADAQKELDALSPRLPNVIINVKGPAKSVTVDGTAVPIAALGVKRPVDPGSHLIRVEGDGQVPVEVSVTLAEGKVETVTLELEPAPHAAPVTPVVEAHPRPPVAPPPPPPQPPSSSASLRRTLGFVGIGVGGAGLVMGAVTGGLALSKHSELSQNCRNSVCLPGEYGTLDSYNLVSTLSTVGFVAGGVLAATGIVLVATAPKAAPATTGKVWLSPVVGAGYAGVEGAF